MNPGIYNRKARAVRLLTAAYEWVAGQPLLFVAFAAAVFMGLADLAADTTVLTSALGDTDDAARLIEVRALLAGQGWFDMRLARFGGADVLVSHWSRLIDLPLAAMIYLLSPVFGQATAEVVTRIVWPTALCGLLAFIIARFCQRQSNRHTALIALLLAVPCTGHFQFLPGRIDHHNAMIIGAVGGTFALLAALDRPRAGWLAGILLGFGCAVGFEGLGMTLAVITIGTASAIFVTGSLEGVMRAAVAFAGTLLGAYLVFGPARPDSLIVCDALSVNLIALALCGAAGVVAAHRAQRVGASTAQVFGIVSAGGVLGLAVYGYVQPQCLGGPYAQVEPGLGPIWLDHVSEVRSVTQLSLGDVMSFAAYPLVALGYGWIVARGRLMPHAAMYYAIFVVTVALGLWQVRLLPYASFLSVPLIAIGLCRQTVADRAEVARAPEPMGRGWEMAGGLMAAMGVIAALMLVMEPGRPQAAVTGQAVATGQETFKSCTSGDNVKGLAQLPAGLAANDIDLGSYLVAWTKLSVMSAPYHRMGRSILATHDLLHASAAEAPLRMKALGARYVVLCGALADTIAARPPGDALRGELLAGRVPDGLEAVAVTAGPIKVWRLVE